MLDWNLFNMHLALVRKQSKFGWISALTQNNIRTLYGTDNERIRIGHTYTDISFVAMHNHFQPAFVLRLHFAFEGEWTLLLSIGHAGIHSIQLLLPNKKVRNSDRTPTPTDLQTRTEPKNRWSSVIRTHENHPDKTDVALDVLGVRSVSELKNCLRCEL